LLRHILLLLVLLSALCLPASYLPAFSEPAVRAAHSPSPLDLLPLKKALTPLDSMGTLQSHSTISMAGTRQGISVMLHEDLQIVSRYPNHFRATLTQYDTQGGFRKKLIVVSNGALVWTYRPGLRQYSVVSLASWKKADNDIPTLGLVIGGFYLGDGRPLVQGFHSITPTNSADVLAVLNQMDVTLSRQIKASGDQDDYVYRLTLAKQSLAYKFYVNSQTNALTRVDLSGTQDHTDFSYREDIARISPRTAAASSTFIFSPPAGTTKTAIVTTDPF
jgi:outer membrane lipoprotein-sorting protein